MELTNNAKHTITFKIVQIPPTPQTGKQSSLADLLRQVLNPHNDIEFVTLGLQEHARTMAAGGRKDRTECKKFTKGRWAIWNQSFDGKMQAESNLESLHHYDLEELRSTMSDSEFEKLKEENEN